MNESSTKDTVVFIQEYVSKPNSPESILGMFDAVFGMTVTKPHIFLLDEKEKKEYFGLEKERSAFLCTGMVWVLVPNFGMSLVFPKGFLKYPNFAFFKPFFEGKFQEKPIPVKLNVNDSCLEGGELLILTNTDIDSVLDVFIEIVN